MFYLLVIFSFLLNNEVSLVSSAIILGLMAEPSQSHHIWNSVLMTRFAELGHNITVLSLDLPKSTEKLPPNLHYIYLEEGYTMYKLEEKLNLTKFIGISPLKSVPMFYDLGMVTCGLIINCKGAQKLASYPDDFKFDLIPYDYTIGPCLLGFVHKFKYPPLVGMSAFHNPPNTIDGMSNHYFPAYVPYHSTTYAPEMSFLERLHNTVIFMFDTAYRRLMFFPRVDAIIRPYFARDMPYIGDIVKRTTLSLVNSHPAVNYVEPLPPNVIEVGGMQVIDPKPLPKDLDEFINGSKNGAVFVSFGTNVKSEDFTENQVHVFVSAMSQLPQYNFIWKFDAEFIKEKIPSNVLVRSFFPQRDILAHPKLKAFVTHCGGLSSQESVWRGVPMVGIPVYFDQHRNLRQSLLAGIAEQLDFMTITTDGLRNAIKKVIEDPVIRANIKAKSKQFRYRPMRSLHRAVWWLKNLVRNPNPYHLQSPAAKLNILQSNSVDCLLVVCTALLLLTFLMAKLLSLALRFIIGANKKQSAAKLKKNELMQHKVR